MQQGQYRQTTSNNCLHYVCHQAIFNSGQHPHVFMYGFPSLVSDPVLYFVATRRTELKPRVWYDFCCERKTCRHREDILTSVWAFLPSQPQTITQDPEHRNLQYCCMMLVPTDENVSLVHLLVFFFLTVKTSSKTTWVISWVWKGQTTDEQNSINERLGLMSLDATHTFTHTHYNQGDHSHINRVKSQTERKTRSSKSK